MGPTRRLPVGVPGWNDQAAVALLVLIAGHLLATEPTSSAGPLTPDRLARVVGAYHDDLPALVAALEGSPRDQVRHGAHHLRRLLRAGQAQVYVRVLPGLPVALVDPYFRLALARRRPCRPRPLPAAQAGRVSVGPRSPPRPRRRGEERGASSRGPAPRALIPIRPPGTWVGLVRSV